MKNYSKLLLLFAVLLSVVACKKNPVLEPPVPLSSNLVNNPIVEEITNSEEYSPCMSESEMDLTTIPQEITMYITTNFPDAVLDEAELISDGDTPSYIIVETEDGQEWLFDLDGNLVAEGTDSEDTEVAEADLPQAILDYIAENHPDITGIDEAASELEFGVSYFEVELSDGSELIFDAEGVFLCEEEDNDDGEEEDNDDGEEEDNDDGEEEDNDDGEEEDNDDGEEEDNDDGEEEDNDDGEEEDNDDGEEEDNDDGEEEDNDDGEEEDNDDGEEEDNDDGEEEDNDDGEEEDNDDGEEEDNDDGEEEDNDDGENEDDITAEIQASIEGYINTNYPDATITDIEIENEEIHVALDNGTTVVFDSEGNFLREE